MLLEIPCQKDVSLFPPEMTPFEAIFSFVPVTLLHFLSYDHSKLEVAFLNHFREAAKFPSFHWHSMFVFTLERSQLLDLKIYIPLWCPHLLDSSLNSCSLFISDAYLISPCSFKLFCTSCLKWCYWPLWNNSYSSYVSIFHKWLRAKVKHTWYHSRMAGTTQRQVLAVNFQHTVCALFHLKANGRWENRLY